MNVILEKGVEEQPNMAIQIRAALKRVLVFGCSLILLTSSGLASAEECTTAKKQGKDLASQQKETRWLLYGAGGAVVLGPLGPGITGIVAAAKPPTLPPEHSLESLTSEQQVCFVKGYNRKIRTRRVLRAMVGGMSVNIVLRTATALLQADPLPED